jgi:hypothetical protein
MSYGATIAVSPQVATITIASLANTNAFTLNGVTVEAVTSGATGNNQFNFSSDANGATNLAALINLYPSVYVGMTATVSGAVVTITSTVVLSFSSVQAHYTVAGFPGTVHNNQPVGVTLTITGATAADVLASVNRLENRSYGPIASHMQQALEGQVLASGTNVYSWTDIYSSSGPTQTYSTDIEVYITGSGNNTLAPTVPTGSSKQIQVAAVPIVDAS